MTTDYAKAREVAEQARETEWTRPSFGKQLFLGDFRLDLVHPAPRLTEEEIKKETTSCAPCGRSCRRRSIPRSSSAPP